MYSHTGFNYVKMKESTKILPHNGIAEDEDLLKVTERLAHFGSWQFNPKTGVGKWSDETYCLLGYDPGEVPPLIESLFKQVYPDDLEYVKKAIEDVETKKLLTQKFEHRVIDHKTKEIRYLETELIVERDGTGAPIRITGFNHDITYAKLVAQKLYQSQVRLLASQHIALIGSWEVDLSGPDPILGKHTYWSEEKFRILGLDPDKTEPTGQNLLKVVHPEDRSLFVKKFNAAIRYGKAYNFEHRIVWEDNSVRIVHERGEVIMDKKSGKPLKMIGTIQDITERKEEEEALKKSEANLRTIFDNTTTVYILVDTDFKIVSFNKGAFDGLSKDLGKTLEAGKEMIDFIAEDKKQMTLEMYKRVFEGEQFKLEEFYTLKDGTTLWYDMQLLPVRMENNKVLNMIVYLSDITKRKNAEFEKEKITSNLLQRNKDLEQFSYIISHNLRMPVANIIGLIDNFTMDKISPAERKEITASLHISAKQLDEIVLDLNKILHVGKKDSENKQLLKLSDSLRDTKISLNFIIKKENAVIESDFSGIDELYTIKSYIASIFYNLILNSIKYRQHTLTPHIRITTKKSNNKILLTFSDNGLGIDLPKKKDEIFGLYKRFHKHVQGKGVGLYMVKLQVEALGGKITVTSEVNKGTIFTIEFEQ